MTIILILRYIKMSIASALGLESVDVLIQNSNPVIIAEEVSKAELDLVKSSTELDQMTQDVDTLTKIYTELDNNSSSVISSESNRFMNIALESVLCKYHVSVEEVGISMESDDKKANTDKGRLRKIIDKIVSMIMAGFKKIRDFIAKYWNKLMVFLGLKEKEVEKTLNEVITVVNEKEKSNKSFEITKEDTVPLIEAVKSKTLLLEDKSKNKNESEETVIEESVKLIEHVIKNEDTKEKAKEGTRKIVNEIFGRQPSGMYEFSQILTFANIISGKIKGYVTVAKTISEKYKKGTDVDLLSKDQNEVEGELYDLEYNMNGTIGSKVSKDIEENIFDLMNKKLVKNVEKGLEKGLTKDDISKFIKEFKSMNITNKGKHHIDVMNGSMHDFEKVINKFDGGHLPTHYEYGILNYFLLMQTDMSEKIKLTTKQLKNVMDVYETVSKGLLDIVKNKN